MTSWLQTIGFRILITVFTVSAPVTFAHPLSPTPIDCLTHRLRALLSQQNPLLTTSFEQKLARTVNGLSPEQVQNDLSALIEEFSSQHPKVAKSLFLDEFKNSMNLKPLTKMDVDRAVELRATQGNILDYRFQIFKIERETQATAKKMGEEIVDQVKSCKGDLRCSNKKVNGLLSKKFSCILGDKKVQSALLSTYLVQNATYLITAKTTDHPYAWDLAFTNALLNPVITEVYCRKALNQNPDDQADFKGQYQNLFLGKKNAEGVRPGFFRTVGSMQMEMIKLGALWAGTYKVANTVTETTLHGKKITFSPLDTLSESDQKKYVTLNPLSIAQEAGSIMLFFDLPFGSQRIIFWDSHIYSIALPHLLKNTVMLFAAQSGIKVGAGVFSTHVFQCWDLAGRNYGEKFWSCFRNKEAAHPELKIEGLVVPSETGVSE